MTISRRSLISALPAFALARVASAAADAPIRVGTLRFGSAAWEFDVMRRAGLDHGLAIETVEFANAQATQVALQSGRVDMILVDWLWVARQIESGADWTFVPFSAAVGALVAPTASPVKSVRDLPGARLGIAGSPIDKSWIILRAYAERVLKLDLDAKVVKSFAVPPLLAAQLGAGQLDAELTFWPFAAKAEAAGMKRVMGVDEMVKALGIDQPVPFVGYVFSSKWAEANRVRLNRLFAALRAAQDLMKTKDAEWQALAPLTGARNPAELAALRDAYRSGVVEHWGPTQQSAAAQLFAILADTGGGPALVGSAKTLPSGVFWPGASW